MLALSPAEFIRHFPQHVLPTGFILKVRYFGFLSPSCLMGIEGVKGWIELARCFAVSAAQAADNQSEHPRHHEAQFARTVAGGCAGVLLPRPLGQSGLVTPWRDRWQAARGEYGLRLGIDAPPTRHFIGVFVTFARQRFARGAQADSRPLPEK